MRLGILILGYLIGVFLLIRFFQTVKRSKEEIEEMENESLDGLTEPSNESGCEPTTTGLSPSKDETKRDKRKHYIEEASKFINERY